MLFLVLFYRRGKVQERLNNLPTVTHSKDVTART